MKTSRFWPLLDSLLLCLLIIAMCSQINLGDIGRDTTAEGYVTKQLKIALPDVTLLLCFFFFAVRTTLLRAWRKIWWPPFPCWALIVALIISVLHSRPLIDAVSDSVLEVEGWHQLFRALITQESKEALAKTVQFTAYFLIAPTLFVNLIHDVRERPPLNRRRLALWSFAITFLVTLFIAFQQIMKGSASPQALFGSANIYAGFCALALPILLAKLLTKKTHIPAAAALTLSVALLLLAVSTLVSFWVLLTIPLTVFIAGVLLRSPVQVAAALLIAGVLSAPLWPLQTNLQAARKESFSLSSSEEKVKKQFVEWYVGATRLADRRESGFATGIGPGNYQFNIGAYYLRLPDEEKMPPDSNNLFLVQAVNTGILGLGALLWVIYHFAQMALTALRKNSDNWLAAGVVAALTSWMIVNLFYALIVRGMGVVLAFILALAVISLKSPLEGDSADAATE